MMWFWVLFAAVLMIASYLHWRGRFFRRSMFSFYGELQQALGLENSIIKKIPGPILSGKCYGYPILLEGGISKKNSHEKSYAFKVIVELPHALSERFFLQHEPLQTKLKPILGLKLVLLPEENFNHQFLLLASNESLTRTLFQPYLVQKILALDGLSWRLDLHAQEAYIEIWQEALDSQKLAEGLRLFLEIINLIEVKLH